MGKITNKWTNPAFSFKTSSSPGSITLVTKLHRQRSTEREAYGGSHHVHAGLGPCNLALGEEATIQRSKLGPLVDFSRLALVT